MGDKKQKEAMIKTASKALLVGVCVMFVLLMILSGMGTHWLTMFTVIKPGDAVVVDYTLNDVTGKPLLTTNQQLAAKENIIYTDKRLSVTAGQNLTKAIYPVSIYTGSSYTPTQFALLNTEYEAISHAIIGMKTGDQKRVQIPRSSNPQQWDAATIAQSGLNVSNLHVGSLVPMAMSDNPEAMATNSTTTYLRVGEITDISGDGTVVDVDYPTADITIYSINANN
jgi:hypothetical protein